VATIVQGLGIARLFLKTAETAHATPPGSVSLRVTFVAVPAPMLDTVMVNAAFSPALMGVTSAVFSTATSGQLTTIVASSVLLPAADAGSLTAETVTVLGRLPQSAA